MFGGAVLGWLTTWFLDLVGLSFAKREASGRTSLRDGQAAFLDGFLFYDGSLLILYLGVTRRIDICLFLLALTLCSCRLGTVYLMNRSQESALRRFWKVATTELIRIILAIVILYFRLLADDPGASGGRVAATVFLDRVACIAFIACDLCHASDACSCVLALQQDKLAASSAGVRLT